MPSLAAKLKACNEECYACTPFCPMLQLQQSGASDTGVSGQDSSTSYRHGARVLLCNDLRPCWDVVSICKATASSQVMSCKV